MFRAEAPLIRSNGWHNEFVRSQQQQKATGGKSVVAQGKQAVSSPPMYNESQYAPQPWSSGVSPEYSMYVTPQAGFPPQQDQYTAHHQVQVQPIYNEAAFEAAFAQATQHVQNMALGEQQQQPQQQSAADLQQQQYHAHLAETVATAQQQAAISYQELLANGLPVLERAPSPSQLRIGSDAIPYREAQPQQQQSQQDRQHQENLDADELARTAGELLSSVQHDTSDKFQSSQFLALMRRIRDGQVRVMGEELRETTPGAGSQHVQDLHPGGPFYPEQSPPPLQYASMAGGYGGSGTGISAADLDEFDHPDESTFLAARYRKPTVAGDDGHGNGAGSAGASA